MDLEKIIDDSYCEDKNLLNLGSNDEGNIPYDYKEYLAYKEGFEKCYSLFKENKIKIESEEESEEESAEDLTEKAIDLLSEIMASHERTYSDLEKKLIETGVVSGRCYVCWHENKYYPGATVDNLKDMGFEKFYETFKHNWEEIKNFRKNIYKNR